MKSQGFYHFIESHKAAVSLEQQLHRMQEKTLKAGISI